MSRKSFVLNILLVFLFSFQSLSFAESSNSYGSLLIAKKATNPAPALSGSGNAGMEASEGSASAKRAEVVDKGKVPDDDVVLPERGEFNLLTRDPLDMLKLDNIKPLYTSPALQGEGVWQSSGSPRDGHGRPLIYRTFYRPSVDFPNAIVYMMVVDMSMMTMRYYVGSQEPAAAKGNSEVESNMRSKIMAVTNAMWMQRHSKGAGAIFRGKVMYPMLNGAATL
ncbi:MAG: hypothetical protein ACP5U1_07150, partial [Desulfomonilaceae bacterium]